jgi:adenosine deaminase
MDKIRMKRKIKTMKLKIFYKCLLVVSYSVTCVLSLDLFHSRSTQISDNEALLNKIIHELPKLELHAHLHGSVRYSTLMELIQQRNLSHLINKIALDASDHGLGDKPFELFPVVHKMVNNLSVVRRILSEMVEDYAKENTIYLEIRTSPRFLDGDGTSVKEYIHAVVEDIYELNRRYSSKMMIKLILGIDRSKNLADSRVIVDYATEHRYFKGEKIIVGLDFSGNPQGGRFDDFRGLFTSVREKGFNITIHTAEAKELSDPDNDETMKILDFR